MHFSRRDRKYHARRRCQRNRHPREYPARNRVTIDHADYGDGPSILTEVWTNACWWQPRKEAMSRLARRAAGETVQKVPPAGRRLPAPAIAEMFDQLDSYWRTRSENAAAGAPEPDS